MKQYQCVASSPRGFIQKIALDWVNYGFRFWVSGVVPERYANDPSELDARMVEKYRADVSRWTRYRNQERDLANVKYIRHERTWVLLATPGRHERESKGKAVQFHGNDVKDLLRVPFRYWGHSVRCVESTTRQRSHVVVQIEHNEFMGLLAYGKTDLWRRSSEQVEEAFHALPYMRLYGVKQQYRKVLDAINSQRAQHNMQRVPYRIVGKSMKFRRVRPFATESPAAPLLIEEAA